MGTQCCIQSWSWNGCYLKCCKIMNNEKWKSCLIMVLKKMIRETQDQLSSSGVDTGVARGQSATPDREKIAKNQEKEGRNQEKLGKNQENQEKRGKIWKKQQKSGSFFTLPLLTERAGYASAFKCLIVQTLLRWWITQFHCPYLLLFNSSLHHESIFSLYIYDLWTRK